MGLRVAAIALWVALVLQFLPALLWAEGAHFHTAPSPVLRQMHRAAGDLVETGIGLFWRGGHRLSAGGMIGR